MIVHRRGQYSLETQYHSGTDNHHDQTSSRAACDNRTVGDAVCKLRIACAEHAAAHGAGSERSRQGKGEEGAAAEGCAATSARPTESRATPAAASSAEGSATATPTSGCAAPASAAAPGCATAATCPGSAPRAAATAGCCARTASFSTTAASTSGGQAASAPTAAGSEAASASAATSWCAEAATGFAECDATGAPPTDPGYGTSAPGTRRDTATAASRRGRRATAVQPTDHSGRHASGWWYTACWRCHPAGDNSGRPGCATARRPAGCGTAASRHAA